MDWERFASRRGSRRWFLGVAGASVGAGAATLAGCGGGSKQPTPGPSAADATETPLPSPTPRTASGGGPQMGETLRYTGYVAGDGVFDPYKTQAGPFYGQQALVYSRLLAYENQASGSIVADLAATMPEQPDGTTLIFKLKPNAKWDERDPLKGRPVTADDVKYSIERQQAGDASFVRKSQWLNVDKVEARDASTVAITLKAQRAAILNLFADVNAFVVPPEAGKDRPFAADSQPGSGPFRWVEWQEGRFGSVARNPRWFGGNSRPYLDGVAVFQPADSRDIEAGLRTKKLDVAFVGRMVADRLKKAVPALQESTVGQLQFFGMRFFLPQAPYNDQRFRSAVSIAIDRRDMVTKFFDGSGDINPWISWPLTRWTLPPSELSTVPGYRPGSGGREQDVKDAKALLAAFASTNKIPEDLPLFVVADAEQNLAMGSVMRDQLKQSLGLNVTIYPVATGELVRRLFASDAPWAAGPDSSRIDLDDCVYPYFHSEGTQNTFPLRDAALDALINAERVELDEPKRREIGYEIQRKLLALNAGVNFVSERVVALAWPYVRNFPLDSTDGYQHRFADCWIDRTDPTYRGR